MIRSVSADIARPSKPAVDQGEAHPPKSNLKFRANLAQGREYVCICRGHHEQSTTGVGIYSANRTAGKLNNYEFGPREAGRPG
eukprot:scaffold74210_cov18-Prasinocladus_malaysianus.AAC.1